MQFHRRNIRAAHHRHRYGIHNRTVQLSTCIGFLTIALFAPMGIAAQAASAPSQPQPVTESFERSTMNVLGNKMLGTLSNFGIVAFDTATLSVHTNSNVVAHNLVANANFGTNNVSVPEASYVAHNYHGSVYANLTNHSTLTLGTSIKLGAPYNNATVWPVQDGGSGSVMFNPTAGESAGAQLHQDTDSVKYIDMNALHTLAATLQVNMLTMQDHGVTALNMDRTAPGYDQNNRQLKVTGSASNGGVSARSHNDSASNSGSGNISVISLTADQLQGDTQIRVSFPQSDSPQALVINLDAHGARTITTPRIRMNDMGNKEHTSWTNENIIINVFDSTAADKRFTGTISTQAEMYGIILAPEATVYANHNIDGQLIVHNANISGGEFHRNSIMVDGSMSDTPNNSDAPANPDTPGDSDEPGQPDTPDTPVTPDQPDSPGTPDQPVTPDTPSQPQETDTFPSSQVNITLQGLKHFTYMDEESRSRTDLTHAFTFTLADVKPENRGEGFTDTATNDEHGVISFGQLVFSSDELANEPVVNHTRTTTLQYTVTESGTLHGVTNDAQNKRTITVVLTQHSGEQLTAVVHEDSVSQQESTALPQEQQQNQPAFVFTNKVATQSVDDPFDFQKFVDGHAPGDAVFTFELTPIDHAPMPANSEHGKYIATNNAEGIIQFPDITYTRSGTYKYQVREIAEGSQYVFDTTTYTVVVDIENDQHGRLVDSHYFINDVTGQRIDHGMPAFHNTTVNHQPDDNTDDNERADTPNTPAQPGSDQSTDDSSSHGSTDEETDKSTDGQSPGAQPQDEQSTVNTTTQSEAVASSHNSLAATGSSITGIVVLVLVMGIAGVGLRSAIHRNSRN